MGIEDKNIIAPNVGKTLNEKLGEGVLSCKADCGEYIGVVGASAAVNMTVYENAPSLGAYRSSSTTPTSEIVWFVLYVRSGSEDKILRSLYSTIDADTYIPFIPTKQLPNYGKKKREAPKREAICFPGYIFFRATKKEDYVADFFDSVSRKAASIDGAYYFLHYGVDKKDIEMHEAERKLLERLLNTEFCMEASIGFQEGDKIRVTSGALMGFESSIKKIYKHKRLCDCEFALMGVTVRTSLALELLEKLT